MALAECLPEFIEPMVLTATQEVRSRSGWALEVKWDGMRAQLRFDGPRMTVRSRPGRECTSQFPELQAIAGLLGDQALFDGELVCFDDQGLPDFERLRSRVRARTPGAVARAQIKAPASLVILEVLHLAGRATHRLPYRQRRPLLESLALEGPAWRTPRTFAVDEALATVTRDLYLEGVVAKRLDAAYQPGRRGDAWLKHKHRHCERLTVTGRRPGHRHQPDEVLVARREPDGTPRYAAGVQFGLHGDRRDQRRAALQRLEQPTRRRSRVRRGAPIARGRHRLSRAPGRPTARPRAAQRCACKEPTRSGLALGRRRASPIPGSAINRSRGRQADCPNRWSGEGGPRDVLRSSSNVCRKGGGQRRSACSRRASAGLRGAARRTRARAPAPSC